MFIGEIILQRRKELKMTQKQLAEKLNVTDRTISRWECGVNLPDVEMLKTVAKVIGYTALALLGIKFGKKYIPKAINWIKGLFTKSTP